MRREHATPRLSATGTGQQMTRMLMGLRASATLRVAVAHRHGLNRQPACRCAVRIHLAACRDDVARPRHIGRPS